MTFPDKKFTCLKIVGTSLDKDFHKRPYTVIERLINHTLYGRSGRFPEGLRSSTTMCMGVPCDGKLELERLISCLKASINNGWSLMCLKSQFQTWTSFINIIYYNMEYEHVLST